MMTFTVRSARPADAAGMARVHLEGWRQTYRGLMADEILDAPDFVDRRERFWTAVLGDDPRFAQVAAAVALVDDEVVGIAMTGPTPEEDRTDGTPDRALHVLYVLADHHGTGVGAALLDAVAPASAAHMLWVADPHPRAQAFSAKHGFVPDGTVRVDEGVHELRMTRPARSSSAGRRDLDEAEPAAPR
ncbi:GNAT family N-acetyltransferase [Microbacterium sp. PM5]|uniref:GNAT family N-acetyltransferase n=1 Tax=Microbacterium sp. PM5 TaxID=2014534 RepID=UPI000DD138A6|nr:GNAT family N-acetyltransferase [Microbacterium sp. PM5]AXA96007.1 GNAT family N-acetyltransferase [Microbacterium sp. PM5]